MRNYLMLALPWLLLFLACSNQAAGGAPAKDFEPLLTRLPPDADIVVIADLAEAGRTFRSTLDRVEKTPAVAQNPEIAQAFRLERAMLDTAIGTIKSKVGLDPLADLTRAALAIKLPQGGEPAMVMVVSGKIPPDLPAKLFTDGHAEKVSGKDVWRTERGPDSIVLDGKLLLLADPASFPKALEVASDNQAILQRHPDLAAGLEPGFLLRLTFAPPDWLKAAGSVPQAVPGLSLLAQLKSLGLDFGSNLHVHAVALTAATAENLKLVFEGWRELMIGGLHLSRAYGLLVVGLDLGSLPNLPPQLRNAFQNRQALLATVNEFLTVPASSSTVVLKDRDVSLHVSHQEMMGNTFIMGILAAVAIPAFISYIRKSKASEATVQMQALARLEDQYRQDHGGYLACDAAPEGKPSGDPRPWPKTGEDAECFQQLGFDPGPSVYFTYRIQVAKDSFLIRAWSDLDNDGQQAEFSLRSGENLPRRDTPEGIW